MTATAPQHRRQANDASAMAVAPLRKRAAPLTLLPRSRAVLDRLPRAKELADAEFWTAAGLETVSVLRDV